MKILDSNKEAQKYRIKQAVKFILLSAFFVVCFFWLGITIYQINEESKILEAEVSAQQNITPLSQSEADFLYAEPKVEKVVKAEKPTAYPPEVIPPEVEKPQKQDDIKSPKPEEAKQEEAKPENTKSSEPVIDGAALFYQKLAELEAADKKEAEEKEADADLPQEELDKLYEEKLPDNVIVEDWEEPELTPEQIAEGYHIYQRHMDVKKLNIIPKYKPAYFGEEPVIAVVIDDMGIAKKRTADIISLNAPLTASFLTYGANLENQVKAAEAAGMEIMLHAPMEPYSKVDVAPDVLTTQMSLEEVHQGLEKMLAKFQDVKGINNHMGSKFTEDKARMQVVMEVLKEKGLFFLDSKTTPHSVGKELAQKNGVSYATRHVFIDNKNQVDYILNQLKIAEKIAKRNGYAVAIGHPKSGTYEALKQWLPSLKEKKIKILHMSDIVKVLHKSHI